MRIMKIYNENLKTFSIVIKRSGVELTLFEVLHLDFPKSNDGSVWRLRKRWIWRREILRISIRSFRQVELIAIEKTGKQSIIS